MEIYEQIEAELANEYGSTTTSRKAIGDFMLSNTHAVNVKSNNVNKSNYSPNMISIKKMHEWVFKGQNNLSFIFVDYRMNGTQKEIIKKSGLTPLEHIGWECLSIEAQGYGVIQLVGGHDKLVIKPEQTKREFYEGFIVAYEKYRQKEHNKHAKFSKTFIKNTDSINW